jgi:hypothetical protein
MGVLYEVFVVEIESLQIRLHWSSSRRKMEALPPCLPPPKFSSLLGGRLAILGDDEAMFPSSISLGVFVLFSTIK